MSADGQYPISAAASSDAAPHNIEAEQALLGALLFDNEVANRIDTPLRGEHFYDPVHGRIWEAATAIVERGGLADPVTLKDAFARDGGLSEIGGPAYLAALVTNAALPASAPAYARLVYELALRRALIRVGSEIAISAQEPDPEKDARSQIEEAERMLHSLAEAGQVRKGFQSFREALKTSIALAAAAIERESGLAGISTGFRELDRMLGGLHKSDLVILAGRPSMGKTALGANIAFNVARKYRKSRQPDGTEKTTEGGVVAFFSLEMAAEQLATRILAEHSRIASEKIRKGDLNKGEFEDLKDAVAELNSSPLYIDDTGGISIGQIAARARRLQRSVGLDLIIVDYLQLVMPSSNRRSDSRVQEVSEVTKGLKALAKELSVPIIALSQLSRGVENREDKRPQLADLRESGSIEQDADMVLFVYREAYYLERQEPREGTAEHLKWQQDMDVLRRRAEVIIGKQRHGPIGKVELGFNAEITKFSDLDTSGRYDAGYGQVNG
jgi:replicative DNA helicase